MEIRSFSSYDELEKVHQKDLSGFPIIWLVGRLTDDQIKEKLRKIGACSLDECVTIFGGGVIKKTDAQKYIGLLKHHDKEREAFLSQSEENLVSHILAEMNNHEYGYTRNPISTLSALGKSIEDIRKDPIFRKAWKKAEKKCYCILD